MNVLGLDIFWLVILEVIILVITLGLMFYVLGRLDGKLKKSMIFIALALIPQMIRKVLIILNILGELDTPTARFITVFLDLIFVTLVLLAVSNIEQIIEQIDDKHKTHK